MIGVEEARIGAKIISERLGEKSEWKYCKGDYKNIGLEKLINHMRAEIITLNGLEDVVLSHEKSKIDDFVGMIDRVDGAFGNFTGQAYNVAEKTWEALEETEDNWFKIGLKLGIEIEKRKSMIAKVGEMKLSKDDLKIISETAKYID